MENLFKQVFFLIKLIKQNSFLKKKQDFKLKIRVKTITKISFSLKRRP